MVFPLGQISFPVTFSDGKHSRTTNVNFMVMPVKSRHDVLIGRETQCHGPRPGLTRFRSRGTETP
ncbi:hypothetical protein HanXRQr2_Chr03g0111531 [Helianthus annuus]|uniref:Uncharacterized protein n=1 Tax=Helianthus annuus TaxID=4232 RepID=A0A9K3JF23_HELAN|nr:hypothetical protein HanXRQr2_Chr03g0111531 [Helianthus annuus]KAJ0943722.1 hypothetical protein HanPSC8_Chr03g0107991 [Helianthus annuus]